MDFKLPDIGEGIHEGEIVKWLVKQGDTIAADQPMVEVMTDKATVEIPSPVAGTIEKVFANEGQVIEVGKVLVTIAEAGKAAAKPAPAPEPKAPTKSAPEEAASPKKEISRSNTEDPAPAPKPSAQKDTVAAEWSESDGHDDVIPFTVLATPATRKLARDLKVDLKTVKGTGTAGRITKDDVKMAHENTSASEARPSHSMVTTSGGKPAIGQGGALQKIPLRGIRKKIAEAMTHSKHTAAHFTYVEEVDMSNVVALRKSAAPEAERRKIKLTFLPFIIKAVIPALKEFPYLNSSLDEESQEIILKGDYNIGIATDTPNGLIVPNIKNADRKSIWEIAEEISVLSEAARNGKSRLEDLKGGTFTLTNAGSIGGVLATPIINYPEVAILGVNAIRKRPIVKDDEIVIGDVMFLSISVDHRIVDGADAARFMNRLVYFLSEPSRLVFA